MSTDTTSNNSGSRTTSSSKSKLVGLVAKPSQPAAIEALKDVMQFLTQRSIAYRVDKDSAAQFPGGVAADLVLPRSEIAKRCSLIVVLGGDGTLISVGHFPVGDGPAIIGVNLGTLGFMTEISRDELFVSLELALDGRAKIERRPLLRATVNSQLAGRTEYFALNDVVISKEALARIFGIAVRIDGDYAANVRGDGVIISTPCGSTGYNLAAGGSIVHPQVDALLLTPLCPHSLTSRPLVLPGKSQIQIEVLADHSSGANEVYLTIDGQEGRALRSGDTVTVQTSEYSVGIVKSPSHSYYELLGSKLKWANH